MLSVDILCFLYNHSRYNTATNTYPAFPALNIGRWMHGLVRHKGEFDVGLIVIADKYYALGGNSASGEESSIEVFNSSLNV